MLKTSEIYIKSYIITLRLVYEKPTAFALRALVLDLVAFVKHQGSVAAGARSSESADSKGTESGATSTSAHVEETEVDPGHVELIRKNVSKRSREKTKSKASPAGKKIGTSKPAIGKKGSFRTLY
ncbi:hypothetical protein Hanom_Chr12g01138901 [Helianthus anomalus]